VSDTYDLRTSQYDHPEANRGQHTNGPSKIFVRRPDGPWYRVRYAVWANAKHKVRLLIAMHGFDDFVLDCCDPLPQEPPQ
jgi:hypothetical protein